MVFFFKSVSSSNENCKNHGISKHFQPNFAQNLVSLSLRIDINEIFFMLTYLLDFPPTPVANTRAVPETFFFLI